jgi:hypothetical protein
MENGREGEALLSVRGGGEFKEMVAFTSPDKGLGVARGPTNGHTLGQESGHKKPTRDFLRRCLLHPYVTCKKNPDKNLLN